MVTRLRGALFGTVFVLTAVVFVQAQAPGKIPARAGKAPAVQRDVALEPEMVRIPAGEFLMGANNSAFDRERPAHRVYVSEFYISKYVVSNTEYKRFIDATGHRAPANARGERHEFTLWKARNFPPQIARQPVVNVSWDDAVAYSRWLSQVTGKNYRLPTEAEWEKAARGGLEQKEYPWGGEPPDERKAWFGKGFIRTWKGIYTLRDVGYGTPNGYGLYGMAGNVQQWVADVYLEQYYRRSPARDPQGLTVEETQVPGKLPVPEQRVLRGGSWAHKAVFLRCAFRNYTVPADREHHIGFRVVRR